MLAVFDLGFSALKYKLGDHKGRIVSAYTRMGDDIIVGDEALLSAGSNYLKTPEELVRHYPIFVARAMQSVGTSKADVLTLAVGLPYAFWKAEHGKGIDNPDSAICQIRRSLMALNCCSVANVHVFPQGLGGITTYLNSSEGGWGDGNVMGIDIGFNTVISALYSRGQQKTIYSKTFYKRGVHQMATKLLLPKIEHLAPGRSMTPVEISRILERRELQYGLDRINLSAEIDKSAKTFLEDTISDVVNDIRAEMGSGAEFGEVCFFGGGARYFSNISSERVRINILSEPEYANLHGFEIMALKQIGVEERRVA